MRKVLGYHISAVIVLVITQFLVASVLFAATSSAIGKLVSAAELTSASLPNGKPVRCLVQGSLRIPGKVTTRKQKLYFLAWKRVLRAKLQDLKRRSERLGKKNYRNKVSKARADYAARVAACNQDSSSPTNPGEISGEILPQARRIDWSYAGVPGGIPHRSTICTVLGEGGKSPGFNQNVTASQIESAFSNCPADQVVYLNTGTYTVGPINLRRYSNRTLRGAGPGKTIINSTGGTPISSDQYSFSGATLIPQGATKGATSVVLASSNSQFAVGNLVKFDLDDDTDLVRSSNGPGRHISFQAIITAVDGTTISFSPPLAYDLAASRSPKASYLNGGPGLSKSGVEDMTIVNNGGTDVVSFIGTYACWVKNVELKNLENTGVFFVNSLQGEVRDSYIHSAEGYPNNSDGFGVYLYDGSGYQLIENNIFEKVGVGVLQSSSSGNAILYNYSADITFQSWPYQTGAYNANHGAHPMMVLWEGNVGEQWQSDGYHGSASHQTLFRNWFHGDDPYHVGTYVAGNRKMISAERGSYYFNVIGNVLGAAWATSMDPKSRYEMTENGEFYLNIQVIYRLGYPNVANNGFTAANPWSAYSLSYPDAKVKETMIRHGNYDYFNAATVWDPSVSDRALPSSLFHTSKPAWWPSALQWPPIGPDLTPKVNRIPAEVCYEDGAKDSQGTLSNFDAALCYSQ